MIVISRTLLFIQWIVVAAIIAVTALMVIRLIADAANLNPFSKLALLIRQLSDPFVFRMRRGLMGFGIDPKYAPIVVILIAILLGYFALQLADTLAFTVAGLLNSLTHGAIVSALGYIIYGAVSLYIVFIFMRIVFGWGMVSYSNRIMKFLVNVTEPLLGPLRRIIPPLGMMDISPIVAFLILWLFQQAIAGTLLRGAAQIRL
jgi:Predicted integral membrane protein